MAGSCRKQTAQSSRWTSLGNEFDSINNEIEHHWFVDYGPDTLRSLTEELESLARTPDQKRRVKYWKFQNEEYRENNFITEEEIKSLTEGVDSLKQPYDFIRYKELVYELGKKDYSECLKFHIKAEQFYKDINDYPGLAMIYNNNAKIYFISGDFEKAGKEQEKAGKVLKGSVYDKGRIEKQNLNFANVDNALGDKEKALSKVKEMLDNPEFRRDPLFVIRLYNLAYKASQNMDYLYKALVVDSGGAKIPSALGFFYLYECKDSLEKYARMTYERSLKNSVFEWKANSSYLMYRMYLNKHMADSALFYQLLYDEYIEKHEKMKDAENYERAKLKEELHAMELERTRRANRIIVTIILAVSVLILLSGGFYMLWRMQVKNLKLSNAQQQVELARLQRQEAFRALSSQRTRNTNDRIIEEVEEMAESNIISPGAAKKIGRVVKSNSHPDIEWDELCKSIEKIHPEFQRHLRNLYPEITETMLRTALYTRMGISGKRLADILGIEYQSVKKRRWLLRSLLGLQKGENLEARLAELEEEAKTRYLK